MPTENSKISLYVPQVIYDRFIEYKKKLGLSMSQAGTVLLAEYFGIEETIKDITEGSIVGGVTISRVEAIEQELKELKERIDKIVNQEKITGKPEKDVINEPRQTVLQITNDISQEILLDNKLLSKRLSIVSSTISVKKTNLHRSKFLLWLKESDPDKIGWDFKNKTVGKGVNYFPISDTPVELLNKLKEWVNKNTN